MVWCTTILYCNSGVLYLMVQYSCILTVFTICTCKECVILELYCLTNNLLCCTTTKECKIWNLAQQRYWISLWTLIIKFQAGKSCTGVSRVGPPGCMIFIYLFFDQPQIGLLEHQNDSNEPKKCDHVVIWATLAAWSVYI